MAQLDLDAIKRNTAHLGQHETIVLMCDEIERLRARLTQIEGQASVADSGNWRDVIDNIKHIAEGRFS